MEHPETLKPDIELSMGYIKAVLHLMIKMCKISLCFITPEPLWLMKLLCHHGHSWAYETTCFRPDTNIKLFTLLSVKHFEIWFWGRSWWALVCFILFTFLMIIKNWAGHCMLLSSLLISDYLLMIIK